MGRSGSTRASGGSCLPALEKLMQSFESASRRRRRCLAHREEMKTNTVAQITRRLQYPFALLSARSRKSLNLEHTIGRIIRDFVGFPPSIRVLTYHQGISLDADLCRSSVKAWHVGLGRAMKDLESHTDAVLCGAVHGNTIVTGSHDTMVKVWDATSGALLHTLPGQACVCAVAADHLTVVCGYLDGTAAVWDLRDEEIVDKSACSSTPHRLLRLEGRHTGAINAVAIQDQIVVTGSDDWTAHTWDTGNEVRPHGRGLAGHRGRVLAVAVHSSRIATASADGTVRLWQLHGSLQHVLRVAEASLPCVPRCCLQFCEWLTPVVSIALKGDMVVTGSASGMVHSWDAATGKLRHALQADRGCIGTWPELALGGDKRTVAACWKSGALQVWDAKTGGVQHQVAGGFQTPTERTRNQAVAFVY